LHTVKSCENAKNCLIVPHKQDAKVEILKQPLLITTKKPYMIEWRMEGN